MFTGHLKDATALFQAANVFLLPTTLAAKAGNPIALLEVAARGLSVVGTHDTEIDSQIKAAGGLVAPTVPPAFASIVTEAPKGDRGQIAATWAQAQRVPGWLDRHEELLACLAQRGIR